MTYDSEGRADPRSYSTSLAAIKGVAWVLALFAVLALWTAIYRVLTA